MSSLLLIYYLHKGRLEKEDGGSLHSSLTNLFWLQLTPRWKMYRRQKEIYSSICKSDYFRGVPSKGLRTLHSVL
jgi:hypothetical protein